jgi:hypothetical protein
MITGYFPEGESMQPASEEDHPKIPAELFRIDGGKNT